MQTKTTALTHPRENMKDVKSAKPGKPEDTTRCTWRATNEDVENK